MNRTIAFSESFEAVSFRPAGGRNSSMNMVKSRISDLVISEQSASETGELRIKSLAVCPKARIGPSNAYGYNGSGSTQ